MASFEHAIEETVEMIEALKLRRLGVALGAEVEGLDLRTELTDDVAQALRDALDEHQVLFLRGQDLSDEDHVAVAAIFGTPRGSEPFATLGGYPQFSAIPMTLARSPEIPADTENWHADLTYLPDPPVVGVLCPLLMPAMGGDTVWVSLYSVYDSLSASMQEFCTHLSGLHTWEPIRGLLDRLGADVVEQVESLFPPQAHPLVHTHPRTGRQYLYFGGRKGWMEEIVELRPEESEILLGYLRRGLDNVEHQVRWHWSPGDVAIWEERTTNHKGMSDHYLLDPNRIVRSVWAYPAESCSDAVAP